MPPTDAVRKTVTVLFADVVSSTALGERLDPEALRHVMARYFEEARTAIERHGGTVEKFIGDAVMAVFGIPTLHEDDALRAVRAADDLRASLRALNEQLEPDSGVTLEIRIGVNTGEVVAGRGETLVTGDAVNVSKRLEEAAGSGEVLAGETTYRLARDAVEAEPVEPLALKGKSEAVAAFRVLAVREGAPGRERHLDSPMVGRERERSLLQQAFERACDERACHLFTVLGAAGVGKSRLLAEFVDDVGEAATVVRGRCLPYGEGITFWPLLEVVRRLYGEDPLSMIAARLTGDENAELIAERVAAAVGLAESAGPSEETFWAVRKLFEAHARERPLVVVFDDVQWGEPTFLDLVEHVADWSRDAPILLVCLARPELLDERSGWGGGKFNATSVLLEPLSKDESVELVDNLLGQAELAADVQSRVMDAAEGNPLFVEEMLGMLIDDGLLERMNGDWVAVGDLGAVSVPPTIQALLSARLDRLHEEERAVIERASIEGKLFHRGGVAELSPEELRPKVGTHLQGLVRKELVRPDRPEFPGEDAFRFRHMLVRDAAYEAMPKELRADLHERFADWLGRTAGERVVEYEEILGYHLEQAHRYRAELAPIDERARALASQAAEQLASAGRRAFARGDMHAAANLLERAAGLLPDDDAARLQLLPSLSEALIETGNFGEAENLVEQAIEAAASDADQLRAHALILRSLIRVYTKPETRLDEVRREAERAIPVFEEAGDEAGLAKAWRLIAWAGLTAGRADEMNDALERAVAYSRAAGDLRHESEALSWLALGAAFGPTPHEEGLRRCHEIRAQAPGNRSVDAGCLQAQAFFQAMLGHFEQARKLSAQARAIYEDLGLSVQAAGIRYGSGFVETLAGDLEAAERELRIGYDFLQEAGETGYLSTHAAELAHALYAQGRDAEAEAFSRVSQEAASEDDMTSQIRWRSARAKVLARRGESDLAERLGREAAALAEETDYISTRGDTLMDLAEVLTLAGRQDEATAAVEQALRLYEQKGNAVQAKRARALLRQL